MEIHKFSAQYNRMRRGLILIITVLVFIAILAIYYTTSEEGFETPLEIQRQNRTNPLAAKQHPLTNPAAKIGTDETSGSLLRKLAGAALNLPYMNILGHSTAKTIPVLTPRIDEEGSFLDDVNFCEARGKMFTDKKQSPFKDEEFKSKCGMCMTAGKLANGKTFTKPTGVMIYKKDKEMARERQNDRGYKYPRLVTSLKSAKCNGEEDAMDEPTMPVIVIDDELYSEYILNLECQEKTAYNDDKNCGRCVVNPKQWSYVNRARDITSASLFILGQGTISINKNNAPLTPDTPLSIDTPLIVNLGAKEDDTLSIVVKPTQTTPSVSLGAYVKGTNPDGTSYYLDLLEILTKDLADVSGQINLGSVRYVIGDISDITAIIPTANPKTTDLVGKIMLEGKIPFTLTKGQFADLLCPGGPYTTTAENEKILGIADPCMEEGQAPGLYSKECIQTRLQDAGCYQGGEWWNKGLAGLEKAGLPARSTLDGIKTWLTGVVKTARTTPAMSMGCYGIDVSTPCDAYVGTDEVPSDECLAYMYSNKSENSVIGKSYITENFEGVPSAATGAGVEPKNYRSLNNLTDQYCQPRGEANPAKNANSVASLREVAKGGFDGRRGLDAVKMFLTKQYNGAVGPGRISVDDVNTGPKTNWDSCFGVGLLPSDVIQSFVAQPGDLSGGGTGCTTKEVCTYEAMPANTNIITPQCNTGSVNSSSLSRCFSSTLDQAKAKCDKDPACDGITMQPGVGYEPRSMSKSVSGAVGAGMVEQVWGSTQGASTNVSGYKSWKKKCTTQTVCAGDKKCTYGEPIMNKALINPSYCTPNAPNYNPDTGQQIDNYESKRSIGENRCVQMSFEAAKAICDTSPDCIGIHAGHNYTSAWGYEPHRAKGWEGLPGESATRAGTGVTSGLANVSGWKTWMKKSCDGDAPAKKCNYGSPQANTDVIGPQCPPGSRVDETGFARCYGPSLESAKSLCDADPACDAVVGVTLGGTSSYEPKNSKKTTAGLPYQNVIGVKTGRFSSPGFTTWMKGSCDGDAAPHAS